MRSIKSILLIIGFLFTIGTMLYAYVLYIEANSSYNECQKEVEKLTVELEEIKNN